MAIRRLLLVLLLPVIGVVELTHDGSAAPGAPARLTTTVAGTRAEAASVRVAVANLHEGSLAAYPPDQRDRADVRVFARRLLGHGGPPDVVALQEVLGSAEAVARILSDRAGRATYDVVAAPRLRTATGACDGARRGRFLLEQTSAILVNRRTVTVEDAGTIRTWGRWNPLARSVTDRTGFGCSAQPWARVTVRHGTATRTVRILDVHLPPAGGRLKNSALTGLPGRFSVKGRPADLEVIGGDYNLTRCRAGLLHPEPWGCAEQPGHRAILDAGYVDLMRRARPHRTRGVVGAARRIDFLHVRGRAEEVWWDRCYQGWRVSGGGCGGVSAFDDQVDFQACQARVLAGRGADPGCPTGRFHRYYSDHPILVATLS